MVDKQLKERLVMQAAVLKAAKEIHDQEKKLLLEELEEGERVIAKNSEGVKLGTLSKTAPEPKAVVEDMAAVCATLTPDDFDYSIPSRNMVQALAVIGEHAPELLDFEPKAHILAEQERAALAAHKAGEELPAGWGIHKKAGYLTIRPTEDAKLAGRGVLEAAHLAKELEQ
ncbi:hypothetical protein [Corynebacterium aquilae]|uniref:Uncharacterized protein n=1 Tax=Corynebacterium aquilae DSM 44791 TaxID=1431546 RepID=A0A1L7CHL1_9CORY|nr:hypothetical protein [Corynebacterium aquilae]APT85337.1 hypothetical protein CAQU_10010 [Corynebacterium aquilae DSM 44791]